MPYFQDPKTKQLYFVPAGNASDLPATFIGISDAEAEAILNPPPAFEKIKADKRKSIAACCDEACVMGVVSAALGTPHLYPTKVLDQQNLNASVVDSLRPLLPADWTTPYMCQDVATGVWDYRYHTAGQIQQAGSEVKAGILVHLVKNAALQKQIAAIVPASTAQADIDAATTALNTVVWA